MQAHARNNFALLKQTFLVWQLNDSPRLAAALAYYTTFSLAPLIVLLTVIAGFIFDQREVRDYILAQVTMEVGTDAAQLIGSVIDQISRPQASIISTILSVGALLLGAIGVFAQLQGSLNRIWGVSADKLPQGVKGWAFTNLLSLGMVLAVGFLLLVSLVISTVLTSLGSQLNDLFPGAETSLSIINFLISFAVITLLFAVIYRLLPRTDIAWHDVWGGAVFTALLFTIGKTLLSLYLSRSGTASVYGAAGSLVVVLLWIYYAAQILLLGAAFTNAYAKMFGSRHHYQPVLVKPNRIATDESRKIMSRIYERLITDP